MFGGTSTNTSMFGNPAGNPGTIGTAGTLFSSAALSGGLNATAKPGFSFGQPATSTPSLFAGVTAGSAGATTGFGTGTALGSGTTFGTGNTFGAGSSFGTGGGFGVKAAGTSGFPFGASTGAATTTTNTLTGFGTSLFGGTATSSTVPTLGLGGFGTSTTSVLQGFPAVQPLATNVGTIGLGGIGSTTISKSDSKTLKEYPVPNEINELVETFKNHIKVQKGIREEISHVSSKSLNRVVDNTETMKQQLSVISNGLQRNAASIKKLRLQTVKELKNAEVVQRTKEIPFPLQYENTAPMEYFTHLILDFEQRMCAYRQQIEALEKHLVLITESSLTPQDLLQTIKKLQDAFISIAAQLQVVHENIEAFKERLTKLGINVGGGSEQPSPAVWLKNIANIPVSVGPSPFGVAHSSVASAFASAYERAQQMTGTSTSVNLPQGAVLGSSGFGSSIASRPMLPVAPLSSAAQTGCVFKPLGSIASSSSVSASSSLPTSPVLGVSNQDAFQLQKPPIGNKRGKR